MSAIQEYDDIAPSDSVSAAPLTRGNYESSRNRDLPLAPPRGELPLTRSPMKGLRQVSQQERAARTTAMLYQQDLVTLRAEIGTAHKEIDQLAELVSTKHITALAVKEGEIVARESPSLINESLINGTDLTLGARIRMINKALVASVKEDLKFILDANNDLPPTLAYESVEREESRQACLDRAKAILDAFGEE